MILTTFAFTACGLRIGTPEEYEFWGEPRWNVPAMSSPTTSVEISPPLPNPLPLKSGVMVVDPFTGSGNTLYWILHHLPGAHGMGLEQDPVVFQLTSRNLAILNLSIAVSNLDYKAGLSIPNAAQDQLLIAFIAPPWGDALNRGTGLDLRRTMPPISEIVEFLISIAGKCPLLCAIQVYETLDLTSVSELMPRFSWSTKRMYGLNAPGQNHGLLMGTRGWVPWSAAKADVQSHD